MADNCGGCEKEYVVPNIVINITFNDNRMNDDASTYIDNVTMTGDDGEEFPIDFTLDNTEE